MRWNGNKFPWQKIPIPSCCCKMKIFSSGWWDQKIMSRQIAMIGPRRIEHIWRWGTVMKWRCSPPQTAWLIMYLLSRSTVKTFNNSQGTSDNINKIQQWFIANVDGSAYHWTKLCNCILGLEYGKFMLLGLCKRIL